MATKFPSTKRKFASEWDEIDYLYHKILYWFYPVRDRAKALKFSKRLESLLKRFASRHEAIFGEECWSLVYEVKGDLDKAIEHREREIKLIQRLWAISKDPPAKEIVRARYDASDLSDRYDLLAILYHERGDLDKAIQILIESKAICDEHGIRFDGKDQLREYLAEKDEQRLSDDSGPKKPKAKQRITSVARTHAR